MEANVAEIVRNALREVGFAEAEEIRPLDVDGRINLLVPKRILLDASSEGRRKTRQIAKVRLALHQALKSEVVVTPWTDPLFAELEAELGRVAKKCLSADYVFVHAVHTSLGGDLGVFVRRSEDLVEKERDAATKKLKATAKEFRIAFHSITIARSESPAPSGPAILRALKRLQPADAGQVAAGLTSSGQLPPSVAWLRNQLDSLRKKGFAQWDASGAYRLTLSGLAVLPQTRGRQGADVERALALARRRW